jgi:hypothetical protein
MSETVNPQLELELAAALDAQLEQGFEDFEAGRFQAFDSAAQLRAEVESRVKARALKSNLLGF